MHPLHRVAALLDQQDGVVTRRQLLGAGVAAHEIERLVRRREAVLVGRGVLITHTGPPTWRQRVWCAVLAVAPAAAADETAVVLAGVRPPASDQPLHVVVADDRRVAPPDGVTLHHRRHLDQVVAWHTSPPRVRLEHALLDVATARARRVDGIADLADAVGSRATTSNRLRRALAERSRAPDRRWWSKVLDDLGAGTHSVLEHGYLTQVEQPHGLPRGERQVRRTAGDRITYSDVEYADWGLRVELDGFATHRRRVQHERDLDRDVLARVAGAESLRLGWQHVFERSCWTAGVVAQLLGRHGWSGQVRPCSASCGAAKGPAA